MTRLEERLRDALFATALQVEASPDLFARIQGSIEDDIRRRAWRRKTASVGVAGVTVFLGLLSLFSEHGEGGIEMSWWIFEVAITTILVTLVILLAPLLRVGGEGIANINDNTVDYRVDVKLVGTVAGQQGGAADELSGLLIPVRIVGPFENPKIDVQLDEMLKARAKKIRDQEKAKLKAEIEKQKAELQRQIDAEKARLEATRQLEKEKLEQKLEAEQKAAEQKLMDKLKKLF